MAQLISQLPDLDWPKLRGPTWIREQAFRTGSKTAIAMHSDLPIIISPDHEVIVEWGQT
jgi:hypothetical protein